MSTKDRLTLAELKATTVWTDLTSKQKVLVETFIQNGGDRVKAMLAAYAIKSPETARVLAYEYFTSPRVVACLTAYFQGDPLEDFKADVRAAYRNKDLSVAQVRALELHAKINGWASDSLPSFSKAEPENIKPTSKAAPAVDNAVGGPIAPKRFAVGDRVTERDEQGVLHKGIVTKVDEAGQIVDADEVFE